MPKTFDPATEIPDQSGKVILVTGGNSGLGQESVKQLAAHNASEIWLAARTRSTAESTAASIKEAVPKANIILLDLDLGSLESVKAAAAKFTSESKRLDILLLNAGIAAAPPSLTADGYELQFGTNHMGHALFTQLLMPTLLRTAAEQENADVRVVILASDGHKFAPKGGIQFANVKTTMPANQSMVRYGQSKLANLLFARELAARYPSVKTVSVHPGTVDTPVSRSAEKSHPWLVAISKPIMKTFASSVATGAKTQLWACTAKEVKSGAYYQPIGKEGGENANGRDGKLSGELWEWTERELMEHGAPGWPSAEREAKV